MATNFSPCKGSYVLNQFPSNVMFGMNGFHVSASGAIQGHHGPLVNNSEENGLYESILGKGENSGNQHFSTMFSIRSKTISFETPLLCDLRMLSTWTSPKFCHLVKG